MCWYPLFLVRLVTAREFLYSPNVHGTNTLVEASHQLLNELMEVHHPKICSLVGMIFLHWLYNLRIQLRHVSHILGQFKLSRKLPFQIINYWLVGKRIELLLRRRKYEDRDGQIAASILATMMGAGEFFRQAAQYFFEPVVENHIELQADGLHQLNNEVISFSMWLNIRVLC